jgi:hypothetical protein
MTLSRRTLLTALPVASLATLVPTMEAKAMLQVTQLMGFGAMVSKAALTAVTQNSSGTNGNPSYSSVVIPRRGVVVVAMNSDQNSSPYSLDSISLGASAMTLHTTSDGAGIASLEADAGTYTVSAVVSTTGLRSAMAVWLIEGYSRALPVASGSSFVGSGTSIGLALDMPSDSIALFAHKHQPNGAATSWSTATQLLDATVETTRRFSFAQKVATAAVSYTETISWSGAGQSNYAYAIWQ